ncbi:MAG: SUMF1/EgtB/PvdO family nonheme iron enzyme [Thermoguttaceae bacterium]
MSNVPEGGVCPQCQSPVVASQRACPQCNRNYDEPCLACQTVNPFWATTCRGCSGDLAAIKQHTVAVLQQQQQQVIKLRESYGHDKTLPILKSMSLLTHPDLAAIREWAKEMMLLVQKERRDVRTYLDGIREQIKKTFAEQKYEKVQEIIAQVPPPLLDNELRQLHTEAGECITEVDSLVREIRNAIITKQYNTLLSCVQRYVELKANDPEAKSLQEKIEKLTTSVNSVGMKLRRIPTGKFYMGSHESDEFARNNERPQHKVNIARSFMMGVYPVKQSEFIAVMERNTSLSVDSADNPVENLTWYDAIDFCNALSVKEGLEPYYGVKGRVMRHHEVAEFGTVEVLGGTGYRLPTEAEWEYACRAGSITPWYCGNQISEIGQFAWYYDNAQQTTHPVGLKKPNAWGLYDMHGNVMEWCFDFCDDNYYQSLDEETTDPTGPNEGTVRIIRGGSWQFGVESTRCAYRNSLHPTQSSTMIGFRVVREFTDDVM